LGFVTNRQDYVTDGPTDCPPARIRITLKALANFSPGFVLKPWVQKCKKKLFATLKGLRGFAVNNAGQEDRKLPSLRVRTSSCEASNATARSSRRPVTTKQTLTPRISISLSI